MTARGKIHALEFYVCSNDRFCVGCFDAEEPADGGDELAPAPLTAATVTPPRTAAPPVHDTARRPSGAGPAASLPDAPADQPRALFDARFGRLHLRQGEAVELSARTDHVPRGVPAVIALRRRGETEPFDTLEAEVEDDRISACWTPGSGLAREDLGAADDVEIDFTVAAAGLEATAAPVPLERGRIVIAERLVDHDGRPYSEETFAAVDADGREVGRAVTDAAGWFVLEVPRPGEYTLRIADRCGQVQEHGAESDSGLLEDVAFGPDEHTDHVFGRSGAGSTGATHGEAGEEEGHDDDLE